MSERSERTHNVEDWHIYWSSSAHSRITFKPADRNLPLGFRSVEGKCAEDISPLADFERIDNLEIGNVKSDGVRGDNNREF